MSVFSLTTTRRGGHMRNPKTLALFLKTNHWPLSIATAEQVHRARIAVVPALSKGRTYAGVDGLITDVPLQPLGIFTADCVPVFLSARNGMVVGVLHAGWRGVQAAFISKAIQCVSAKWHVAPKDIKLWAGPSIGACCFAVQWDVARYFPKARRRWKDRWRVDLYAALKRQARAAQARWTGPRPPCTMHTGRYFSFRKNQTEKRQISLIMKKEAHEKKS
jgi:YfiH family protein